MDGTEIELLREAYRQLKKAGFHQRSPEEKARLEALFKRLAGFLKDRASEPTSQRADEHRAQEPKSPRAHEEKEPKSPRAQEPKPNGQPLEEKPTHSALSAQHSVLPPDSSLLPPHASLILNVDGASKGNPGRAGAGGVLSTPEGEEIESFSLYIGERTNNEAEYLALIEGLKHAKRLAPEKLVVRSDSLLLVKQMRGEFKVKKYELVKLHLEARRHFPCKGIRFEHVPRERNAEADRLASLGAASGLDSPERPA